jgi:hypothetical protein
VKQLFCRIPRSTTVAGHRLSGMDDSDGDCYHEEGFPSQLAPGAWSLAPAGLEGEQGSADSLPDLVLSATVLSPSTQVLGNFASRTFLKDYQHNIFV